MTGDDPLIRALPCVTRLDSGYWHARWSAEIWAQWPVHRTLCAEDFFHPSYTATPARIAQAMQAVGGNYAD